MLTPFSRFALSSWTNHSDPSSGMLRAPSARMMSSPCLTAGEGGNDGAAALQIAGSEPAKAIEAGPSDEPEVAYDPWGIDGMPIDVPVEDKALVVRQPDDPTTVTDADRTESQVAIVDVMAPRKDTRSAAVPGWRFKVSMPLSDLILDFTIKL